MNTTNMGCISMEEKTEMTIENVQAIYQTIADIFGNKFNVNIKVTVEQKKKGVEKSE